MNPERTSTGPEQAQAGSRQNPRTVSQKLITRVALLRIGLCKFEDEVNKHLADGWVTNTLSIDKRGLRIVCSALLEKC